MPLTEREAGQIVDVINGLIGKHGDNGQQPGAAKPVAPKRCDHKFIDSNKCAKCGWQAPEQGATTPAPFEAAAEEALYQKFKARLLDELPVDPILLSIVMARPEIRLMVERREVQIDGKSLKGRLAALIASGFVDEAKKSTQINRELDRTGGQVNSGNLGKALADFRVDGLLTQDADGWQRAPGVTVTASTVSA